MARKKKQPTPEQFWDESGQLRFVVIETFNGEQHRGFWTGAPHESAFIGLPERPDRRGITPSLKQRVRAEEAALEAIRKALQNPIAPNAETAAKHRIPPSERQSPFARDTLDWYRNELALAQDRIRLLEGQRERLVRENDKLRKVVAKVIEKPVNDGRKGRKDAERKLNAAAVAREKAVIEAADKVLQDHPKLPRQNLTAKVMSKVSYSEPTVRSALQRNGYVPRKTKS